MNVHDKCCHIRMYMKCCVCYEKYGLYIIECRYKYECI